MRCERCPTEVPELYPVPGCGPWDGSDVCARCFAELGHGDFHEIRLDGLGLGASGGVVADPEKELVLVGLPAVEATINALGAGLELRHAAMAGERVVRDARGER